MRELTDRQSLTLERISSSSAAGNVTVVGWADNGPVLRLKHGALVVIKPEGNPSSVNEF